MVENNCAPGATNLVAHQPSIITAANGSKAVGGTGGITNEDKIRARSKLIVAIRRGDIVRLPCYVCGDPNSEGHHSDYTKPLDVDWLCRKHHRLLNHPNLFYLDEFSCLPRPDRRKEKRRLKIGLCRHCKRPRVSSRYCEHHLKLRRESNTRYRRKLGIPERLKKAA